MASAITFTLTTVLLVSTTMVKNQTENSIFISSLMHEISLMLERLTYSTPTTIPIPYTINSEREKTEPIPIPIPLEETTTQRRNPKKKAYLHYSHLMFSASLLSTGLWPNSYATRDIYLTGWDAKRSLALPTAIPPNAVYLVVTKLGFEHTREGRVQPMMDNNLMMMPGGGYEYFFEKGSGGPGTVMEPCPLPTGASLLNQ